MGQAKLKQRSGFAPEQVDEWENEDCVDFAVALARLTGWLLHVDWWTTSYQKSPETKEDGFKPIRVYVGDDKNSIFDPRGVMSIAEYNERITKRQIRLREFHGTGGVLTRFYSEEKLSKLPLRFQPNEARVQHAIAEISRHPSYLASIPLRAQPCLPAHEAARFSFGKCSAFAEALRECAGLTSTALLAVRMLPGRELPDINERGYFHSVCLHSDGLGEDSWGKAQLSDIAMRFGVSEFVTSEDEQRAVVQLIRRNTPENYDSAYNDALTLIHKYTER